MVATPKNGTLVFKGRSGRNYEKDVYLSDVASGLANWDSGLGASATSETSWTPPEPVLLRDYAQVTGTADTTKVMLTRNGNGTGDVLRYTVHLTSLNNRPVLNVPFNTGDRVALVQLA